jgi:hypothetical protein
MAHEKERFEKLRKNSFSYRGSNCHQRYWKIIAEWNYRQCSADQGCPQELTQRRSPE